MPVKAQKGTLVAFSETGTEGTIWCIQINGRNGAGGLHALRDGDVLRVFNDKARKKKVWEGTVALDYQKSRKPNPYIRTWVAQWVDQIGTVHGLQKGVTPAIWAKMFLDEKPATIIIGGAKKKG